MKKWKRVKIEGVHRDIEISETELVRTTVMLPPELWRKIRIEALNLGVTASELMAGFAAEFFDHPETFGTRIEPDTTLIPPGTPLPNFVEDL